MTAPSSFTLVSSGLSFTADASSKRHGGAHGWQGTSQSPDVTRGHKTQRQSLSQALSQTLRESVFQNQPCVAKKIH